MMKGAKDPRFEPGDVGTTPCEIAPLLIAAHPFCALVAQRELRPLEAAEEALRLSPIAWRDS